MGYMKIEKDNQVLFESKIEAHMVDADVIDIAISNADVPIEEITKNYYHVIVVVDRSMIITTDVTPYLKNRKEVFDNLYST